MSSSFTEKVKHEGGQATGEHSSSMTDAITRKVQRQQKPPKHPKQQKHQSQQPRQLLSCTKCRERKVKCDRLKPCMACCARGTPKDCHFVAEDGDYAPIAQAYEIKRLRTENLRLKERLRSSRESVDDEESDHANSSESQWGESTTAVQNRRTMRQRRFQGSEWQDSLYFGSPTFSATTKELVSLNLDAASAPASLTHLMPRGAEIFSSRNPPTYPFPTLFPASLEKCVPVLLSLLPIQDELFENLASFEKRVSTCSFPLMPVELSDIEVERFLADLSKNAHMCPDMLALLFAVLALGCQHSVWDKAGGEWNAQIINAEMQKGEVYVPAAKQALRLANFMQKPSLLGIQAHALIGCWLINSGRFLDASADFGTTIRLAQSIGLHRHPKYLNPVPSTHRECSVRQTIWWWMLRMDEQYSMTLGRPLGISGIGDCPPPHELTTNPVMVRFSEFVHHLTLLGRRILSSDRLTPPKIDEYTDELKTLLETMPETLQFNESWLHRETDLPEWPLSALAAVYYCKIHTYLILLNRQRTDKHSMNSQMSSSRNPVSSFRPANRTVPSYPSTPPSAKSSLRGRPLVLSSAEDILNAFLFIYQREPAALIDWSIGQQVFNACMILLIDAIENRQVTDGARRAEAVYGIFKEMEENDVHRIAGLAVERISRALHELHKASSAGANAPKDEQAGTSSDTCHSIGDTVMGNTGMFLLEDPGLQGFTPETWTPLAWGMPEMHPHMTKEQNEHYHGEARPMDGMKLDTAEDELGFRSVEGMHDMRRSLAMRSGPPRYPTPSEDGHTLDYSDTASDASFGVSQHNFMNPTPLLQSSPAVESMGSETWEYEAMSSSRTQMHDGSSLTSPMLQQVSPLQFRHNSCPSITESSLESTHSRPRYPSPSRNGDRSSAPQMLRSTPLRASMAAGMGTDASAFQDYLEAFSQTDTRVELPSNAQALAARGAGGPIFNMADTTGTNFLPTGSANGMSTMGSRVAQGMLPGQAYPFSSRSSDAGMANMASFAETVENWQRRMGIGGHGPVG